MWNLVGTCPAQHLRPWGSAVAAPYHCLVSLGPKERLTFCTQHLEQMFPETGPKKCQKRFCILFLYLSLDPCFLMFVLTVPLRIVPLLEVLLEVTGDDIIGWEARCNVTNPSKRSGWMGGLS